MKLRTNPKSPGELRRALENLQIAVNNTRTDAGGNLFQQLPESEPPNDALNPTELAPWVDVAGGNLMFKYKTSSGTILTGSLAIS